VGPGLPAALVERLSQRDLHRRLGAALPFVTVDEAGWPHPMLVSYLEVRAYDAGSLGLVIQSSSRSARHLARRGAGTLIVADPEGVFYVKCRALDGPRPVDGAGAGLGFFLLQVEEVLEDAPGDWEGGVRLTQGLAYAPPPDLNTPWVRATLAALAEPRARA
jgi:hypothetical protein